MNKLILVFLLTFNFFIVNADENKASVEVSDNSYNSFCMPPFARIFKSEKLRNEYSFQMTNMYLSNLKSAELRPYFCQEEGFHFRVILGIGVLFPTPMSIQFYEINEIMYMRIGHVEFLPEEYLCNISKNLIVYKMNSHERNKVKNLISKSGFWNMPWEMIKKDDLKNWFVMDGSKDPNDWFALFEGVSNESYHSSSSRFKNDGPYSIMKKEKSDDNLATLARELFGFAYEKIKKGEVRYFEFDKKWEDLKPFEGCKAKEEKKSETGSEKITK